MSLSRDSRTEKKLKALRRAEFRLKQQFEYIDWSEEVLYPEIEAMKAGRPVLGLEAGAVFDLQVADAHQNLAKVNAGTTPRHPRRAAARRARKPSGKGA